MNTRLALVLLLILAVATGWFLQKPESGGSNSIAGKQGPDMFANQVEVTVMDTSGQALYHVKADQLLHSPATERFNLVQPVIELKRAAGDKWKIIAERGEMTDNGEQLWFLGGVTIRRMGDNPLHIQTSDLLVKPDEELAETEHEVSISTAQYKIDAIGLKADFRNSQLELKSRVRGKINAAG